jgi:hypothetical protein
MAIPNDITSAVQVYVETQSGGAVTEPKNGSWLAAYCLHLGVTQPVNGSWLQALCNNFGITQPLHGSWVIALANYYSITTPLNNSWWFALADAGGAPPVVPFTWVGNTNNWEAETRVWETV